MVPSSDERKTVDLSRLTDDEAKHIWQVIQRDFHLRKKEEDRLGELKTKIMKEDTKKELLGYQPKLSDSLCIRCLQPFKFLLNSKRQCLHCRLSICKSCSRFNKQERGWICNPCHMARVLKIGTLDWFHENVRSRFTRFGSDKVMNFLIMRRSGSPNPLRDDDTHSMPETNNLYSREDEQPVRADRRHFSLAPFTRIGGDGENTRKARRLLPVDPLDFNLGVETSDYSQPDVFLYAGSQEKITQSRASVTDENFSTTFKKILENGSHGRGDDILHTSQRSLDRPSVFDDYTQVDQRMTQARSLSKMSISSAGSASYHLHRELSYSLDGSEDEESQMHVMYSPALQREPSPDTVPPQITELKRRMSAIETLLRRLEQKMLLPVPGEPVEQVKPNVEEDLTDLEELELRKKLDELTDKISDHGLSSDEDDAMKPLDSSRKAMNPSTVICGALAGLGNVGHDWLFETEERKSRPDVHEALKNQRRASPFDLGNITSCELSQLEGKVAMTAVSVQSTQSGVTDIQKRIAALSTAGLTGDASRRRASLQPPKVLHEFPIRTSNESRSFRKLSIM